MSCPTGLHRRRRGEHLLMCLTWKYLSVMEVQIPDKKLAVLSVSDFQCTLSLMRSLLLLTKTQGKTTVERSKFLLL